MHGIVRAAFRVLEISISNACMYVRTYVRTVMVTWLSGYVAVVETRR